MQAAGAGAEPQKQDAQGAGGPERQEAPMDGAKVVTEVVYAADSKEVSDRISVNLGMFAQEVKAPEAVQKVLLFNSRPCWALGDGTGELSHNVLTEIAMT